MNVEEFAPHMRPAAGLNNPTADEQFIEPGIAVGMDDATKVLQMRLRMLAFTIGRVEEQSCRRPRASEWPLIANVGPQPAGLGLAGAWREHRHRGIVDMQSVAGQHVGRQGVDQRLQRRRCGSDPAAQGGGLQAHPRAGKDLGLTIERQVIVIFRHDNMSEQPRPGATAGDRVVGCWRRHHRVTNPARQFLSNVPDDLEAARHVIECLGHLVGDLAQCATTTGTGAWRGMAQILSRQVLRQRAARRLLRFSSGLNNRGHSRRCCRQPLRLVGLQRLERQFELLTLAPQLLRGAAKLGAPITGQLEFQPGDLGLRGQCVL